MGLAAASFANPSAKVWVALVGGASFTAVIAALVIARSLRTTSVERTVRERANELAGNATEGAAALRERAELFDVLDTVAPIGIYRTDATGRCLYTNPRWQEMTGLSAEASLGEGYMQAIHPEDRARVLDAERDSAAGKPSSVECRLVSPAGEVRWTRLGQSAITGPDGRRTGSIGTVSDVTEQKRAEEALQESEKRYRVLADQSSDFIARHRIDGVLAYASSASSTLLGYAPHEIIGTSYYDLLYPADVDVVRSEIAAAAQGAGVVTVSHRVRRKDGEYVWLEATLRVLHDPVSQAPIEVVTVSRDISERKRIEQMRQDLVAMLSHDLKNPLTAVLGFAEILRELPSDDAQRDEYLLRIEANAHTALSLAANFVEASQIDSGSLEAKLEPVFLNDVVEHVLRQQESRARVKQIRLETRLDRSGPMALLDRRLIDRVIVNLVNNAIKYSPANSRVLVETTRQDGVVVVRVQDQGPGIPPEQRAKLFERFSKMSAGRIDSTGLGLFIVKTLVDAQQGTVRADFPPEGGTVFVLAFPLASANSKINRPARAREVRS